MAGGRDDHVVAHRFEVRHRFALDLTVRDQRCQVGGRFGPASGGEAGEVRVEVADHRSDDFRRHLLALEIGVLSTEQLLGQGQHAAEVLLGETEDLEDHLERERHRDVDGEVAMADAVVADERAELRECLVGQFLEPVVEPLDRGRFEPFGGEAPVVRVFRRIHVDQGLDVEAALFPRGTVGEHRHGTVGEQVRLTLHLEHLIVADHRPERIESVAFDAMDRSLLMQRQRGAVPFIEVAPPEVVGEDVVGGGRADGHVDLLRVRLIRT